MRITQGTFSYLPDITDDEIRLQIQYALDNGWPLSSSSPTTRIPGTPAGTCGACPCSTCSDAAGVLLRSTLPKAYPGHYIS